MADPKSTEARRAPEPVNPIPEPPQDRVTMVSLTKEGIPDQTSGFTFEGDKQAAIDAAKVQFAQQAASAVDEAERTTPAAETTSEPDADVKALMDKHQAAAKRGESAAESLVNARFKE